MVEHWTLGRGREVLLRRARALRGHLTLPFPSYACAGEDRETLLLPGKVTAEALAEFVNAEKLPITLEFNQNNNEKIFQSGISKHVSVFCSNAGTVAHARKSHAYTALCRIRPIAGLQPPCKQQWVMARRKDSVLLRGQWEGLEQ